MAGIMDMFRSKAPTPPANATATGTNQTGVNANNSVPNDSTIQNTNGTGPGAIPKAAEGDKSPLAEYSALWHKDEKNDGKEPNLVPNFKTDPAKLMESAKNVDFVSGIDPKVLDAAAKGDKEALGAVVNQAAQLGFARSAAVTTSIVERALQQQAKSFKDEVMPHILRNNEISRTLREDNELFSNPAVAPMLEMVEKQFAIKYPKASPAEVSQKAKEYVQEFGTAIVTANGGTVTPKAAEGSAKKNALARTEMDWSAWFEGDTAASS